MKKFLKDDAFAIGVGAFACAAAVGMAYVYAMHTLI